jgi:hypothetical protein
VAVAPEGRETAGDHRRVLDRRLGALLEVPLPNASLVKARDRLNTRGVAFRQSRRKKGRVVLGDAGDPRFAERTRPWFGRKTRKKRAKPPHPKEKERQELLRRFEALSADERLRRTAEFAAKLGELSTSEKERAGYWNSTFAQVLRHDRSRERFRDSVDRAHTARGRATPGLTAEARKRIFKTLRRAKAQQRSRGANTPSQPTRPIHASLRQRTRELGTQGRAQPRVIHGFEVSDAGDGVSIKWPAIDRAARIRLDVLDRDGNRVARTRVDAGTTRIKIGKLSAYPQPLRVQLSAALENGQQIAVGDARIDLS